MQQLDPIYVDVNQSSSEWLQLKQEIDCGRGAIRRAGSPVTIVLEDGSDLRARGASCSSPTSPWIRPPANSCCARMVPNPEGLLLPGMYVRAVINEGVLPHGLLAPQQGITHDPKGNATRAGRQCRRARSNSARSECPAPIGDQWLVDEGLASRRSVDRRGSAEGTARHAVQAVEAAGDSAAVAGRRIGGAQPAPATGEDDRARLTCALSYRHACHASSSIGRSLPGSWR